MAKEETETRTYTVMNLDASSDWERAHGFSVIEANIANANSDLLLGTLDSDSGSMVMMAAGVNTA